MKTKMPVRRNFKPTKQEMAIRRAIHVLQDAANDQIVLMQDTIKGHHNRHVYLIPSILPDGNDPIEDDDGNEIARPEGTIEYQICDGLPGERGNSHACFNFVEAVKEFNRVQQHGW